MAAGLPAIGLRSSPGHGKISAGPDCELPMPLPLIYHEDYSPEFPAEHRFPMDKFRLREGKICID